MSFVVRVAHANAGPIIENQPSPVKETRARPTAVTHEEFEALWDANDVARYLKASRSWVYMKAEAGVLPSLRLCGLLRFDPSAIKAFARGEGHRATVLPLQPRSR